MTRGKKQNEVETRKTREKVKRNEGHMKMNSKGRKEASEMKKERKIMTKRRLISIRYNKRVYKTREGKKERTSRETVKRSEDKGS